MNRVSPANPLWVVAKGLNDAFVPSACSHALMTRTFSDVIGIPSLVRKSRAQPTESTPAGLSVPELVGALGSDVAVPCACANAAANEVASVAELPSAEVVLVVDVPSTPRPVGFTPNRLSIS
jgi:hypothetical protein